MKTIFIIRQKVSSDPRFGISRMYRTWEEEFETEEEAREFVEQSGNDSTDICFEYIETERDYTDEEVDLARGDYLYDCWKDEHMS